MTAVEQVKAGATAVASVQFTDYQGEPLTPGGDVTVGVTRSDGSTVLPPGTATQAHEDGRYSVGVPAEATAALDVLTAAWASTEGPTATTQVEVVGGFYATSSDVRAADPTLADDDRYATVAILRARRIVETEFERITGRAFVPRFGRVRVTATAYGLAFYEHPDVWPETVTVDGVASEGMRHAVRVRPGQTVTLTYTYGRTSPPADVFGAFVMRLRDVLNRPVAGVPARTQTYSSEAGGTFSLIVPGQRGAKTGIPDVDVVLADYTYDPPRLA